MRTQSVKGGLILFLVWMFLCPQVLTLPAPGQIIKNGRNPIEPALKAQFRRKMLATAFDMLRARGVPFDPELLADDDWRSELESALALMPETRKTVHVTEPMKGVYLACTLLLPEQISLKGDTFILTRELAPDGENSAINITGTHSLFVFDIGDQKKYEAMIRSARRGVPPMVMNFDVALPCVFVGIAPRYIGHQRCEGGFGPGLAELGQGWPADVSSSGIPHLLDPDFEAFKLARDPLSGWYSHDVKYSNDASVMMTPDNQIKVQGQYSLRIEQTRPRDKGQAEAFLSQAVRLPKQGGLTRNFDLSVQMRSTLNGRVKINVYVLDASNIARSIAQRDVKVHKNWKISTLSFTVPEGYDQFGVRFNLPLDNAQLWLDDIRLMPVGLPSYESLHRAKWGPKAQP